MIVGGWHKPAVQQCTASGVSGWLPVQPPCTLPAPPPWHHPSAFSLAPYPRIPPSPSPYQSWINGVGKAQKRKGKRLFMPMRVALTGRMAGPDVGEQLGLLALEAGDVADAAAYVPLAQRLERLRAWQAAREAPAAAAPTA